MKSKSEPTLYTKIGGGGSSIIIVALCVDDLVFIGKKCKYDRRIQN